jgi:NAD(P)-dependent dehydrogenase (short-subunit alcohol dehydrogenase family)
MKHKPIGEQVVVVLGAASGIGRETALRFASRGAKVVVADNDASGLETLVAEISGPGGVAISVVADTADFAQVSGVAETECESSDAWTAGSTWQRLASGRPLWTPPSKSSSASSTWI